MQYELAWLNEEGKGLKQDYEEAELWYRKAADAGHSLSQFELAKMYDYGWGVTKDYGKAVQWYKNAADQGHLEIKVFLASLYRGGGPGSIKTSRKR